MRQQTQREWGGNDDGAALGIPRSHASEVGTFPFDFPVIKFPN